MSLTRKLMANESSFTKRFFAFQRPVHRNLEHNRVYPTWGDLGREFESLIFEEGSDGPEIAQEITGRHHQQLLFRSLNYLFRLRERMQQIGFQYLAATPDDGL